MAHPLYPCEFAQGCLYWCVATPIPEFEFVPQNACFDRAGPDRLFRGNQHGDQLVNGGVM